MNPRRDELMIIGLGNPGEEYAGTRHNVGFLVVDALARNWRCGLFQTKWQAEIVSTNIEDCKVHIIKPQTYMNRSGFSVSRFCRFYKVETDQILVIHDDLDMHVGRVKLVKGGGAGGHKGIKSITEHLGTKEFFRLKIGIGRPGKGDVHKDFPVEKYVLSNFVQDDLELLGDRCRIIEKGLRIFIADNPSKAMNLLNGLK